MQIKSVSALSRVIFTIGLTGLASQSFGAPLPVGYLAKASNVPLAESFKNDMATAVKTDRDTHGCFWGSRPDVYIFDTAVLYVTGSAAVPFNYNSFPIADVASKGCSLPVKGSLVGAPVIKPVVLNDQAVLNGSKVYGTFAVLEKKKNDVPFTNSPKYDLSGLQVDTIPEGFVADLNGGVQLTQRQFKCTSIGDAKFSDKPFIYSFFDAVILTNFTGTAYQAFKLDAAKAAGCLLPKIERRSSIVEPPPPPTPPPAPKLAKLKQLAPSFDFDFAETTVGDNMNVFDLVREGKELNPATLGCTISKYAFAYQFEEGVIFTKFKNLDNNDASYELYFNSTLSAKGCSLSGGLVTPNPDPKPTDPTPSNPTDLKSSLKDSAPIFEIEAEDTVDGNSMEVFNLSALGKFINVASLGCSISKKKNAYQFKDGILFTSSDNADSEDFFYDIFLNASLTAAKCQGIPSATTPIPVPLPGDANKLTCAAVPVAKVGLVGRYGSKSFDENTGSFTNRAFATVVNFTNADDSNKHSLDFFAARSDVLAKDVTLAPDVNFTVNLAADKKLVLGNFEQFIEVKRNGAGYTVERFAYVNSFKPNEKPAIQLVSTLELNSLSGFAFNPWVDVFTFERFLQTGFGVAVTNTGLLSVNFIYPRVKTFQLGDYYSNSSVLANIRSVAAASCKERFMIHSFVNDPEPFCAQDDQVGGQVSTLKALPYQPKFTDFQLTQESCSVANSVKPAELHGPYVSRPLSSEFLTLIEKDSDASEGATYRQFFAAKAKVGADYLAVANSALRYVTANRVTLEFGYTLETKLSKGDAYIIGYVENGKIASLSVLETLETKKVQERYFFLQMNGVLEQTQTGDVSGDFFETDVNQMLRHSFEDKGNHYSYTVNLYKFR